MYVVFIEPRLELLIGIGCGIVVLLLLLVVVLALVVRRRYKDRGGATLASRADADVAPARVVDHLSIPRPRPRVWQSSASTLSVDRHHKRRRSHDDDDDEDLDEDLELHRRPNGGLALPRAAANGRLSAPSQVHSLRLTTPPGPATDVGRDNLEQPRTPRLRRYFAYSPLLTSDAIFTDRCNSFCPEFQNG